MGENNFVEKNDFVVEDEEINKNQYKKNKSKNKKYEGLVEVQEMVVAQENVKSEEGNTEENIEDAVLQEDGKVLNLEDEVIVEEPKQEEDKKMINNFINSEKKEKRYGKVVRKGAATISIEDENGKKFFLIGHKDAKVGDIIEY